MSSRGAAHPGGVQRMVMVEHLRSRPCQDHLLFSSARPQPRRLGAAMSSLCSWFSYSWSSWAGLYSCWASAAFDGVPPRGRGRTSSAADGSGHPPGHQLVGRRRRLRRLVGGRSTGRAGQEVLLRAQGLRAPRLLLEDAGRFRGDVVFPPVVTAPLGLPVDNRDRYPSREHDLPGRVGHRDPVPLDRTLHEPYHRGPHLQPPSPGCTSENSPSRRSTGPNRPGGASV